MLKPYRRRKSHKGEPSETRETEEATAEQRADLRGPWINVSIEQSVHRPLDVQTQVIPVAKTLSPAEYPRVHDRRTVAVR